MKPETLAELWDLMNRREYKHSRQKDAHKEEAQIRAILSRHVEQPAAVGNAFASDCEYIPPHITTIEAALFALDGLHKRWSRAKKPLSDLDAMRMAIDVLRTVEQPAETEERAAMSELREWLAAPGTLRAASISPISVKLQDYRAIREWFVTGSNDDAAICEALRLAKETDNAD